ncbi:MAG: hypothetical protein HY033_09285 [Ignavibacteriae bacterium]|nr:hypothetical protein [Ignavibacteriota bacterium]
MKKQIALLVIVVGVAIAGLLQLMHETSYAAGNYCRDVCNCAAPSTLQCKCYPLGPFTTCDQWCGTDLCP